MIHVDAATLMQILTDGDEYALLDVRERARYATGHLLLAINLPLSRLELHICRYVPRASSRIILCDDGGGLAVRAAEILAAGGYIDVRILNGGVDAWRDAGHEVFRAHYTMTYAFGLHIERHYATPSISADELKAKMDRGESFVLLDTRPAGEVASETIPGAWSVPFSELAYRVKDLLPGDEPDNDTQLIVHCGAVTRGVLGTESLIEAGLRNPIVMVSNGVRGWAYAGHEVERGCERVAGPVSAKSLEFSLTARGRVTQSQGVKFISKEELDEWQAEMDQRTLHLIDIRSAEEYADGHLAGSISVVGSELVGLYEDHIGTMNGRVCLIDDNGCRAATVASWLTRMGWPEVVVLEDGLSGQQLQAGREPAEMLRSDDVDIPTIDAGQLALLIEANDVAVIDFSLSSSYFKSHVPGSWWTTRAYLAANASLLPNVNTYVTTAEEAALALLAGRDLQRHCDAQVLALDGGNDAWRQTKRTMSSGPGRVIGAVEDIACEFLTEANDDHETVRAANARNLAWQQSLLSKIDRDVSFSFPALRPRKSRPMEFKQ